MKVFVTGAQGFTGRYILSMGQSFNYEMYAAASDVLSLRELQNELEKVQPEAIIHLAAKSFVQEDDQNCFRTVNVEGTENLLKASLGNKVRPSKILIASSAAVYGKQTDMPINEASTISATNAYSESKIEMERCIAHYGEHLNCVITRPFNYTGKGQRTDFLIPKIVDKFKRRSPSIKLGNIHVKREFNDVRFVCQSYFGLITAGERGEIYNVCTGNSYSVLEIIGKLEALTDHRLEVEIDSNLVREGDPAVMFGDPELLYSTLQLSNDYNIEETLRWMLASSSRF